MEKVEQETDIFSPDIMSLFAVPICFKTTRKYVLSIMIEELRIQILCSLLYNWYAYH